MAIGGQSSQNLVVHVPKNKQNFRILRICLTVILGDKFIVKLSNITLILKMPKCKEWPS